MEKIPLLSALRKRKWSKTGLYFTAGYLIFWGAIFELYLACEFAPSPRPMWDICGLYLVFPILPLAIVGNVMNSVFLSSEATANQFWAYFIVISLVQIPLFYALGALIGRIGTKLSKAFS